MEIWKDVPNYEGYYQVSNLGRVRSLDRIIIDGKRKRNFKGVVLKQGLSKAGYYSVSLYKNHKGMTFFIHQLVGICFLGYELKQNGFVVNHKDHNKLNNTLNHLKQFTYTT